MIVKRLFMISAGVVLAMFGVALLAGRSVSELSDYFRAGISTTFHVLENELPDVVHDEKTTCELAAAREHLMDRQVQLSLSQNQLKNLEHEIATRESEIADRSRVLAAAFPVLRLAVDGGQTNLTFVATDFSLEEFQKEIDEMLATQERDKKALRIKQVGLTQLRKSVVEGELALQAMKNEISEIELEVDILRTRRDQARLEADTLDLVAGTISSNKSSTANINRSLNRLSDQVEEMEARNEVRRDGGTAAQPFTPGKLTRTFTRLESLMNYAIRNEEKSQENPAIELKGTTTVRRADDKACLERSTHLESLEANEVIIRIKGQMNAECND